MAEFRLGGSRWGVCGWVGVYGVGGRVGDDGVMVGCFFLQAALGPQHARQSA